MVARCRTRHPPTALTIAGSDSGGGAGRPSRPQDLRRAPGARHVRPDRGDGAEHGRGARRRGARTRRSCGSRSRRCSTTSPCAASRPGCWPRPPSSRRWPTWPARACSPTWWWTRSWCRPRATGCWSPTASRPTWSGSSPTRWSSPRTCARPPCWATPTSSPSCTLEARVAVAERIRATGARYVVVKGGHLTESADDVVAGPEGVVVLPGERVATGNDHGTGCSLSAAVAAHLARGATCPRPSRRPRRSWPGRWPGAPPGGWAPGTAPSTISGGPHRRRLVGHDDARHLRAREGGSAGPSHGGPRRPGASPCGRR